MEQLELLARERIRQRTSRRDASGNRRSARLVAQRIRSSRDHERR